MTSPTQISPAAEQTLAEDFARQYERLQSTVFQNMERKVCGCDYGGTSWTTREEADRISELLNLAPSRRLLEVGSGSGWPGLYMAQRTGSDLALVDLPPEALRIAKRRATKDAPAGDCWFAVADGIALPFRDQSFDAISHSDVLCCLGNKRDVLKNCRRLIRSDGVMVFTVISVTPGLSTTDHAHAVEFGPPFVDADSDYLTMLSASGWNIRHRADLTDGFAMTCRRYLEETEANCEELAKILGTEEFESNLSRTRSKVDAIAAGLLLRELFAATPVVQEATD